MQARTGVITIGFGHAGRLEAMAAGGEVDDALQIDAVVGGRNRIRLVQEIHFELAGAEFGRCRIGRQAHVIAIFAHGLEEVFHRSGRAHVIELVALDLAVHDKRLRRHRHAGFAEIRLHHVEFEFGRDNRRQALLLEAFQYVCEDGARADVMRLSVKRVHGGKHLLGTGGTQGRVVSEFLSGVQIPSGSPSVSEILVMSSLSSPQMSSDCVEAGRRTVFFQTLSSAFSGIILPRRSPFMPTSSTSIRAEGSAAV